MADTKDRDRVTRARDLIQEEVEGLEKAFKAAHGDRAARKEDLDYKVGKIDGLRQAGELLGEGS